MKSFQFEKKICTDFIESFSETDDFVHGFRNEFSEVIAYHATKLSLSELEGVKKRGLLLPSKDLFLQKALARFIIETDKRSEEIRKFITDYLSSHNALNTDELNFGLSKTDLIQKYNHYLLFGPESLIPLACELTSEFKISFKNRMYKYGKSLIITTLINTSEIEDEWIEGIYNYWMKGIPETSVVIKKSIEPRYIQNIEEVNPVNIIHSLY